jgi:hypothetical protein
MILIFCSVSILLSCSLFYLNFFLSRTISIYTAPIAIARLSNIASAAIASLFFPERFEVLTDDELIYLVDSIARGG